MRAYAEGLVLAPHFDFCHLGRLAGACGISGDTWAGIVPFSAAVALLFLSGLMLAGAARQTTGGTSHAQDNGAALQIIGLFIIALIYQQSFRWFGYLLPTAIVAPLVLYFFGVRSRIGLALSVILCPLIFHLIFFVLLGVYPPYGEVFDLLSWIQG